MRRWTVGALAAVAVITTAAVLVAVLTQSAGAGPFAWPKRAGESWFQFRPVKPRQVVAINIPLEPVDKPAVLLAVRPLHAAEADGLTFLYAVTTQVGIVGGTATGWHPKAWRLRPLRGFVVPANSRAGIMVGTSATKRGHWFVHAFVVDYEVGGTHYSAPQYFGLEVCVAQRCPTS